MTESTEEPEPSSGTGYVPLTDLGPGTHQGCEGGLYPGGSNERPPAHARSGVRLAQAVRPLDRHGHPDAVDGKVVLLSIGMSNTHGEFNAFQRMALAAASIHPQLVIIDGAQGRMAVDGMSSLTAPKGEEYWSVVEGRLADARLSPQQVQAVWIKQAVANPAKKSGPFPADARYFQQHLQQIVQTAKTSCPNLSLAYLSSRIYAGYATTKLSPEPYAYQSAFAVKWLIEAQLNGDAELGWNEAQGPVRAPWLSWGPYLWADGMNARSDGLIWRRDELAPHDGTHPSEAGKRKVARLLLDFFMTDATTTPWFLAD